MYKRKPFLLTLSFYIVIAFSFPSTAQELAYELHASLPMWVNLKLSESELLSEIALVARLNPFNQRGDFDGDGTLDIAIWVKDRTTSKLGIAIIPHGAGKVWVVGAGHQVVDRAGKVLWPSGDKLDWIGAWYVYEKGNVGQGVTDESPPTLKGDALMLIKLESASGLLYWTGQRYVWYQQGD